jgi:hypothetical protein
MEEFAEIFGHASRTGEGLGQAVAAEGAAPALGLENGGRDSPALQQGMEPGDGLLGLGAEFWCELDVAT